MDKKSRLEMAYRFCFLLKIEAIKEEIDSFLVGYSLDDIKLQNGTFECEFSNDNNNTISLSISPKEIHLYRYNDNVLSSITIREDQILRQVDVEKRENGVIYKEIQKQFAPSNRFKNKNVLVDLIEDSYVFSRDKINRIIDKEDFSDVRLMYILLKIKKASMRKDLKNICDLHNRFSTHMNIYVQCRSGRPIKDNIYPTRTYLNGEEFSSLFDVNDSADKLYKVYDLYNGVINTRNENDINSIHLGFLSEDAFGFRELKGINTQEDELVGRTNLEISNDYINYLSKFLYDKFGYKGEIKLDRKTLLQGITYKMSAVEIAKREIERKLGIPYEEYEQLDTDEQHKLIEQKTGKKFKYDTRLYIDGVPIDEDHIITREQIDRKIEEIFESGPKRLLKRIFKRK